MWLNNQKISKTFLMNTDRMQKRINSAFFLFIVTYFLTINKQFYNL